MRMYCGQLKISKKMNRLLSSIQLTHRTFQMGVHVQHASQTVRQLHRGNQAMSE